MKLDKYRPATDAYRHDAPTIAQLRSAHKTVSIFRWSLAGIVVLALTGLWAVAGIHAVLGVLFIPTVIGVIIGIFKGAQATSRRMYLAKRTITTAGRLGYRDE